MANEWKRATWTYQPVALSHTHVNLIAAIHTVLTGAGWVLASWSGALGLTNYYLRPDRYRCDITHKNFGPSGNLALVVSGAALSKTDLAGGAFGTTASTKATGFVALTAIPADGDFVTVTDGTITKTFEFDSSGGVTSGRVPVVIGATIENTLENLAAAINSVALFNVSALEHSQWWYTGDNYYQHSGILVQHNASPARIEITSFLENVAKTGVQVAVTAGATYRTVINYDNTKNNDYMFIAGEDGFYVEGGTDTNLNNIAHGAVMAFYPDPEMYGTRNRERQWTSQGITIPFLGNLLSYDRNYRFVETVGDRRNHTGLLYGRCARGCGSTTVRSPADNKEAYIGSREHNMHAMELPQNASSYSRVFFTTFGMFQSNFDDLYRITSITVQVSDLYQVMRYSTGTEVVSAASISEYVRDIRNGMCPTPKFGVCSSYLLPWNNIVDKRTGLTYRVARVSDGGRNSNVVIVWPDLSNVVAIPTTP